MCKNKDKDLLGLQELGRIVSESICVPQPIEVQISPFIHIAPCI
jgi:hypothetical protein